MRILLVSLNFEKAKFWLCFLTMKHFLLIIKRNDRWTVVKRIKQIFLDVFAMIRMCFQQSVPYLLSEPSCDHLQTKTFLTLDITLKETGVLKCTRNYMNEVINGANKLVKVAGNILIIFCAATFWLCLFLCIFFWLPQRDWCVWSNLSCVVLYWFLCEIF